MFDAGAGNSVEAALEHLQIKSKSFLSTTYDTGFYVKGFASIEGIDRDGENIPVKAFKAGIQDFNANPQLWLDHRKVLGEDGIEGSIGVVEKMNLVRVEKRADAGYVLRDLETGEAVDTVEADAKFIIKDGDKGLWVVAKVNRPAVVARVEAGEINAFSWSGMLMRSADGRIKHVDIHEVSLVFIPANQRALFTIGKDFGKCNIDFAAVGANLVALDDNVAMKDSQKGSTFAFLKMGATGAYHVVFNEEITDADTAKVVAEKMAEGSAQVALFKNKWKSTPDGCQVYRAVARYEGSEKKIDASLHVTASINSPVWDKCYVDDLPDSSFAYIEHGGRKDAEDKTVPRTLRRYAYKNAQGEVNKHAVARAAKEAMQSPEAKQAMEVLVPYARELNVYPFKDGVVREGLSEVEQELLGVYGEIALRTDTEKVVDANAIQTTNEKSEGGDNVDGLEKVLDAMKGVTDRLDKIESDSKARQDATAKAEADAKAKDDSTKIDGVATELSEKLDAIVKRLDAVENTSKGTAQPDEANTSDKSDPEMMEALMKRLSASLPEEVKKHLKQKTIDEALIGPMLKEHRKGQAAFSGV